MRQCAHGNLHQKSLMLEDGMLVKNFFDNLLRTAHEIGSTQGYGKLELFACHGRPASFPADAIHHVFKCWKSLVKGFL